LTKHRSTTITNSRTPTYFWPQEATSQLTKDFRKIDAELNTFRTSKQQQILIEELSTLCISYD